MKKTLFIIVLILISIALQAQKMTVKRIERLKIGDTGTWFTVERNPITSRTYYLETRQANDTYKAFQSDLKYNKIKVVEGYELVNKKFYKLVTYTTGTATSKTERDTVKNEIINESK